MTEPRKEYKIAGRVSTIFRVVKNKDNPYVMVDRRPVDNPKLSFKAKGILTYLLSRPDGWEVSVSDLIRHGIDGEASIRSGLKELKEAGHMKYTTARNQGRITGWLIEVFEIPQSPDSDFQQVEKQDVENQGQVLSKLNSKQKKSVIKGATPTQPTPPEITLYREVTKKYPPSPNFENVIDSIKKIVLRRGQDVTAADLRPFYQEWTARGYNQFSIKWLTEWALTGVIPSKKQTPQAQPKAFNAIQNWQAMKGLSNGD
jgi:hypothetical protein